MSDGRVIGIDVGTSSIKAIAVDSAGGVVGTAERGYPVSMPHSGWSEQDPALWWEACESALAELGAERCDGIGLSGQMHGLVALDAQDAPLRPAILWNDGRSQPQVDALLGEAGVERFVALSGNRPLAGFTAPKLRWLAEHEPGLHGRIRRIMLPKDYVRLRLTGEAACEVTDASGTLLLDVERRRWSEELCELFAADPDWLPPVHESAAVVGHTGAGVPVAAGAGDQAAGALGVGAIDETGPASLVLGTSGVIFAAQNGYAPDPEGRLHEFCHALAGRWHVMGVILAAAGALAWLDGAVGHGDGIPTLLREAAEWPPGCEGLLFAPYLSGERTPHPDADVRGAFVGLGLRHDRGAMTRAVLEGVAHALRDGLDLIHAAGARPAAARVSGGGARSELWCEILAAMLELPLEHTASASAGAAYGAALLGGVAGGMFEDPAAAARATVRVTAEVAPDPALVEAYAAQRERYRALYPALVPFKTPRSVAAEAAD
ncbi:MAG TPA: xylulokinase [Solirubrobacteraceae bacterium]|nr:xylulokinase [Solirubrobacteraceae bacterium]